MSTASSGRIENILSRGEVGDGHRSRARAGALLDDFKKTLGLSVSPDQKNDRKFEDFIAEVILGAAWYQKRYKSAGRGMFVYIVVNCIAIVGFPFALIGLFRLMTYLEVNSVSGQVTSQLTAILTGILGLQKTLSAWYSARLRYAAWYKSASDLKSIYYGVAQTWSGKASGGNDEFISAIETATATACATIHNERLDYYQKLTLPTFDMLDLLTSNASSVSGLVAKLLPSGPSTALSSVGKNGIISSAVPDRSQPGAPAPAPRPAPEPAPANVVFSNHSLHRPVLETLHHRAMAAGQMQAISGQRALVAPMAAPATNVVEIPLTTVSLDTNFDANIDILFTGSDPGKPVTLLVDSGNSVLVVPYWELIEKLPNSAANYTMLGEAVEPWLCPAKVVKGPIHLRTRNGGLFTISDCVFYACHANNNDGKRTANFGAGCLSPWSASKWNVPKGLGITMRSPLAYASTYPFAEFDYEAASSLFSAPGVPNVSGESILRLYQTEPAGYSMLRIVRNKAWMSLTPKSLSIGATRTGWPGTIPSPIAMIDTGGGPVFLSDPNGAVWDKPWPDVADNPGWATTSTHCQSVSDPITLDLGDGAGSVSYTIDPARLPSSAQGLTLVMCEDNQFMMDEKGMNVGGISALVNFVLIDFNSGRVGLRSKG